MRLSAPKLRSGSTRTAGLLGVALLLGPGAPAGATTLVYEPFDYPAGTVMEDVPATGLNLTGTYTAPESSRASSCVPRRRGWTTGAWSEPRRSAASA